MVEYGYGILSTSAAISHLNMLLIVSKLCCFISGKTSLLQFSLRVSRINLLQIP